MNEKFYKYAWNEKIFKYEFICKIAFKTNLNDEWKDGSFSKVFVEQTSVPVPDVSVIEVALEEEAIESVSSFAICFLLKGVDDGGKARLGILDNVDAFELFSFVVLLFTLSIFFLLQRI